MTVLLILVDSVRKMLSSIEAEGSEAERDDRELIATPRTPAGEWLGQSGRSKKGKREPAKDKDKSKSTEEENQGDR